MMTVFHGSTIIIDAPSTSFGRDNLDFGKGFYVTTLRKQAEEWSKTVARLRPRSIPIVNIYKLDLPTILSSGYQILDFKEYNEEWLDFIVANRSGKKLWNGFDIIIGGIANDRVFDTIENYMAGQIDKQTALGRLKYHLLNNQICIINQSIINKHLSFIGHETIH